ncbi:MAG: tetratricopeptide repeat protein, partial [Vulcanimicrobiaceae bacterium]
TGGRYARARTVAAALALLALAPLRSAAQSYPALTPVPRSTDAAALHALANQREIEQRIAIGFAAEERGAWSAAAAEFSRVLSLGPREPQASTAFYDLGIAQANLGELDAARAAFGAAIARDPGFLAARANLVAVELERGDLTAARSAADAFVAVAPQSARALYARGLTALRARDAATALADFRSLLARNPAYAVAHYDLALAEAQLAQLDKAEADLRVALSLAPSYQRARIALGAVLLREGKREQARATFTEAAQSGDDVALRSLAASLRDAIAP